MAIDNTRSADAIERDIERTQNTISDTVEELQERFSPRALMDSILGDSGDGSDQLVQAAKSNPLGVALIGAGALMLASGRDGSSVTSGLSSLKDKVSGRSNNRGVPAEPSDPHHRAYLAHMNMVEHRDNEPADSYRRRRDTARASYFMLEQRHDEDESSFRTRLDDASDKLRERTSAFGDWLSEEGHRLSDGASSAAGSVKSGSRQAAYRAERAYEENPMVGGLIAAAVGAILGAVIPESRYEDEMLGEYGETARSKAGELADTAKAKASDLADEGKEKAASAAQAALDKADRKLDETGSQSTTTSAAANRDPATRI